MSVSSELTLEVVYYNEQLAVCEPLIEPVEADIGHRPWQIAFSVSSYCSFYKYFDWYLFIPSVLSLVGDGKGASNAVNHHMLLC